MLNKWSLDRPIWVALSLLTTFLTAYPIGGTLCYGNEMPPTPIHTNSLRPSYQVAVLGAPTTGPLVEGVLGAIQKGCRQRFYCNSSGPTHGFVGTKKDNKPLSIKDQPGVFPAPIIGPATLHFTFSCPDKNACLTPIIVRPDGTVFQGIRMNGDDSPQTVVIASPAQTGLYTLFALAHHTKPLDTEVTIHANISTKPHQDKVLYLRFFEPSEQQDAEFVSTEFIYTSLHF